MPTFYYEDLSEKVIGLAYAVYNAKGWGYREKFYEDLLEDKFIENKIKYVRQLTIRITEKNGKVRRRKIDFLIEDKMIIELKVGKTLTNENFTQTLEYLKIMDLRLGLLLLVTPNRKVIPRRVVNEK